MYICITYISLNESVYCDDNENNDNNTCKKSIFATIQQFGVTVCKLETS